MEKERFLHLRKRISWASIFAGVITVLAISVLLAILGSGIGLFMFDLQAKNLGEEIETTAGIWTVISLLISLIAGGFVAGKLAGQDGIIHGFLVWATSLIVAIILGVFLAVGTVKATFSLLGSVSSAAGSIISGACPALKTEILDISDQVGNLFGNLEFNSETDSKNRQKEIRTMLKRSGVREFQPEYLQRQMKAIKSDLNKSIRRIARNPNNADVIMNDFLERLKSRDEKFKNDIDRDELVKMLTNNSQLSTQQAEEIVDEYIELTNNTVEDAKEQITSLEQSINDAKQELIVMKQDVLEKADKAASIAAHSAMFSFFGMLIGAILCAYAGQFGAKKTREGYEI